MDTKSFFDFHKKLSKLLASIYGERGAKKTYLKKNEMQSVFNIGNTSSYEAQKQQVIKKAMDNFNWSKEHALRIFESFLILENPTVENEILQSFERLLYTDAFRSRFHMVEQRVLCDYISENAEKEEQERKTQELELEELRIKMKEQQEPAVKEECDTFEIMQAKSNDLVEKEEASEIKGLELIKHIKEDRKLFIKSKERRV